MADAGQALQRFHVSRHRPAVLFHNYLTQSPDRPRLLRRQAAGADDGLDLLHRHARHGLWRVRQGEQGGGDLVNPLVRALGAEQYGHQQGERVAVIQRDRRLRVERLQALQDIGGALGFQHSAGLQGRQAAHYAAGRLHALFRFGHEGQA